MARFANFRWIVDWLTQKSSENHMHDLANDYSLVLLAGIGYEDWTIFSRFEHFHSRSQQKTRACGKHVRLARKQIWHSRLSQIFIGCNSCDLSSFLTIGFLHSVGPHLRTKKLLTTFKWFEISLILVHARDIIRHVSYIMWLNLSVCIYCWSNKCVCSTGPNTTVFQ